MNKYKIIFSSNLSFAEKINKAEELVRHEVQKVIDKNVKKAFGGEVIWSEFTNDYKNLEGGWENKVFYYYGNLSDFSKKDWRFSKVKDKREEAVFKKLVLHKDVHGLKQNHIRDYNSYLAQIFAEKS